MAYRKIIDRKDFETALDTGRVYAKMRNGNYWQVRRNGKTQLWKTRPFDFSVPVKAGLRATDRYTHLDLASHDSAYAILV